MEKEYDFSKAEARRNPYAEKLKEQRIVNINNDKFILLKNKAKKWVFHIRY